MPVDPAIWNQYRDGSAGVSCIIVLEGFSTRTPRQPGPESGHNHETRPLSSRTRAFKMLAAVQQPGTAAKACLRDYRTSPPAFNRPGLAVQLSIVTDVTRTADQTNYRAPSPSWRDVCQAGSNSISRSAD